MRKPVLRRFQSVTRSLPRLTHLLALGALGALGACVSLDNAAKTEIAIGKRCALDSDCTAPNVCMFGRCHAECASNADCEGDARCVKGEDGSANVCQLASQAACEATSDCVGTQICSPDGQCRDQCSADSDCVSGQVCAEGACADPSELEPDGTLPDDDVPPNGGATCHYNSDCPDELLCINGTCGPECKADKDCAPGSSCVESRCVSPTTECEQNADCDPGQLCTAQACVPGCVKDPDCPDGNVCAMGQCAVGCNDTGDCASLELCAGGGCLPDADGDTTPDGLDNCLGVANDDQADEDADGIGDACEPDSDGDGLIDDYDLCPNDADPSQLDADGDGLGDACDSCFGLVCGGSCSDITSDEANCGACGVACSSDEVCFASQCQILGTTCDWDPANFPTPVFIHQSNYFADVAFDANCDLLVAGAFSPTLFRVSRTTGAVSSAVDIPGTNNMLSVAVRPTDGVTFVVTDYPPTLWSIATNGAISSVMTFPTVMAAIAIAPPTFGAFGNALFGSSEDGNVYRIDPQQQTLTSFAQLSDIASDLAFSPDGSAIYVAVQYDRIDRISNTGVVTSFATGLNSPDGLAVSADSTRLYVADYADGVGLTAYPLPSGMPVVGPRIQFDGGWYTTGVVVDRSGDILVKAKDPMLEGAALYVVPKF